VSYCVYSGVLLKSMANAKAVVSNNANPCWKRGFAQLPLVRLMRGRHYTSGAVVSQPVFSQWMAESVICRVWFGFSAKIVCTKVLFLLVVLMTS